MIRMYRLIWNMLRHPKAYTCFHTRAFLLDYVEGLLAESTARKLAEHLGDCPECSALVRTYRQTISVAGRGAAEELPLPPELEARLIEFMRNTLGPSSI